MDRLLGRRVDDVQHLPLALQRAAEQDEPVLDHAVHDLRVLVEAVLLTQVARLVGARVIATAGSDAKVQLAREAGAHEVINYTTQDFEQEVKRLTDGKGVHVVYDSVGKDTFDKSLNCLRHRGYLALFGFSSGLVPPFDPAILGIKGSLFLTRPGLNQYIATRDELMMRCRGAIRRRRHTARH